MAASVPKNALVTGAGRRIGRAIVLDLARAGWSVAVHYHRSEDEANALIPEVLEVGGTAVTLNADLGNEEQATNLLPLAETAIGKITCLINNASTFERDTVRTATRKTWDSHIEVNLRAPFLLSQAVIPNMKLNNWGRIVNISSILGKISKEYRASYSSSKFGIDGMTAALSAELSEYGILANCVGPGFIKTDLTAKMLGEAGIKEIEKQIPIKRFGNTKEIAELVSWLVSDSNTYLTGQNILIDGGFSRI